jgi:tape measure domain-containing protein
MARDMKIKTVFEAVDKTSKVLGKMQAKIASFTDKASRKFRKLDRTLSGIAGTMTRGIKTGLTFATAGAVALGGALWKIMGAFSKFEDAEARFTPLMKGAEGARKLVERLKKEAETTPFQFENLADTAAQLLPVMNSDIDKTVEAMRMMGDVAGGNVQKMESITRGFMKASLKGKVDMESLNMIAEAGVPIFDELAKAMGKSTGDKFSKSISSGKVKVKDLEKAFKMMTSKGGLFYKGMDLASATLSGRISTLKDEVTGAAGEFGSALAPAIKNAVEKSIEYVSVIHKWIKEHKEIIRSKIADFMKKIPYYMEKAVYWGPKIVKGVAAFYALTAAVKVLNVTMTLFNTLMNINLGPARKVASFMAKDMPASIGKSVGAAGKLDAAFGVISAGLIGYGIGTWMYKNFVEPLQKAYDLEKKIVADVEDTDKRDLSKRNADQLKKDLDNAKKAAAIEKKALASANSQASAMGFSASPIVGGGASSVADERVRKLEAALMMANVEEMRRSSANATYSSESQAPWKVWSPEVSVSETKNETKILSEVTIVDKTGRARVTRGKNGVGGLNLVHTGGM